MKSVLITGAGGFIGRHLVADQLRRGRRVTAVDLHADSIAGQGCGDSLRVVEADFTELRSNDRVMAGHDVCFHLAGAHLETDKDDSLFWKINVEGTRSFLEQCHRADISKFVHCSSTGVHGPLRMLPADEESPCHPELAYEKTKLAGEEQVRAYAREHHYPVSVLRPAWVYGPGCGRTEKLFRMIRKGWFFYVGGSESMRHPVYIDDMVDAFEVAATNENAIGEVFVIGGPKAVTIRELTTTIANVVGVKPPTLKLPLPLVWTGCVTIETLFGMLGRQAPFTRRSLRFFTGNNAFRIDKARRVLGFEPKVDLSEGIRRTYDWLTARSAVEQNRVGSGQPAAEASERQLCSPLGAPNGAVMGNPVDRFSASE